MTARTARDARAVELQRSFDRSFADPPPDVAGDVEDFLFIRVGNQLHAVRLRDVSGVIGGHEILPVPSASTDLLGLSGIRGAIVPVFALSRLLGLRDGGEPGWLLVCGIDAPIALAFAEVEAHRRLPRRALHDVEVATGDRGFIKQVAATDAGPVPVVAVSLVVAALRGRRGGRPPQQEPR